MPIDPSEFIDTQTEKVVSVYRKSAERVRRVLILFLIVVVSTLLAFGIILARLSVENSQSLDILQKATSAKTAAQAAKSTAFLVRCIENHNDRTLAQALTAAHVPTTVPPPLPGCP